MATEPTMRQLLRIPSGEVLAENVSYEDFLVGYDGERVEWVDGKVLRMAAVFVEHGRIVSFLVTLLRNFLALAPVQGEVLPDQVVMRAKQTLPARSPDVMVVLAENAAIVQQKEVAGPADLVVEVVSMGSHRRDYYEKLGEYEAGGVREYWIVDPIQRRTTFYHLSADGTYALALPDAQNRYHSAILPGLVLDVAIFWREDLPYVNTIALVQAMLKDANT